MRGSTEEVGGGGGGGRGRGGVGGVTWSHSLAKGLHQACQPCIASPVTTNLILHRGLYVSPGGGSSFSPRHALHLCLSGGRGFILPAEKVLPTTPMHNVPLRHCLFRSNLFPHWCLILWTSLFYNCAAPQSLSKASGGCGSGFQGRFYGFNDTSAIYIFIINRRNCLGNLVCLSLLPLNDAEVRERGVGEGKDLESNEGAMQNLIAFQNGNSI